MASIFVRDVRKNGIIVFFSERDSNTSGTGPLLSKGIRLQPGDKATQPQGLHSKCSPISLLKSARAGNAIIDIDVGVVPQPLTELKVRTSLAAQQTLCASVCLRFEIFG